MSDEVRSVTRVRMANIMTLLFLRNRSPLIFTKQNQRVPKPRCREGILEVVAVITTALIAMFLLCFEMLIKILSTKLSNYHGINIQLLML